MDTHPYRLAMLAYQREWGLAAEKGFDTAPEGPLGIPGRNLLRREQANMVARHKKSPGDTPELAKVKVSGILDAPTRAVLVPPITFGQSVANRGLSQVGVHEVPWGSNTGPQVSVYQSVCDAYHEPWCACFVSWCLVEEGYRGKVSARAWDWADIGTPVDLADAQVGDIVPFNIGDGHVGIYLSHTATDVKTVDGNTSDQVAVRERPISIIRAITRHTA